MSDLNQVKKGLAMIASNLNKLNIKWSLGASMLLYLEGICDTVDDIDIIVEESDFNQLQLFLQDYKYIYSEPNELYLTDHFYSLQSNEIDVDIMINFKVKSDNGIYKYPFHIEKEITLLNEKIYLSSVKEWYKAYKAMNRTNKIKMLEHFFNKGGILWQSLD